MAINRSTSIVLDGPELAVLDFADLADSLSRVPEAPDATLFDITVRTESGSEYHFVVGPMGVAVHGGIFGAERQEIRHGSFHAGGVDRMLRILGDTTTLYAPRIPEGWKALTTSPVVSVTFTMTAKEAHLTTTS